jgi:hypothetical protein
MSFLKRLFGPQDDKEEVDEIPGQAYVLRDSICACLSLHVVSVEDIAHRIEAGLRPASLNRRVRARLAFIARLVAFLTATDLKACQAAMKAITEALADASETNPLGRARYQLTGAVKEAVSNQRSVIADKKDWGELVSLISRFESLGQEDDGLRFELKYTCECLETIAFRHLDDAQKLSNKALDDLRVKSRLTNHITYLGAVENPEYVNSLKHDPRIVESKKLVGTALSYLDKSLKTRGTRILSGHRDFDFYQEHIDFLKHL